MNLFAKLKARERPVGVALIGAGKFGSMFLNRVRLMPDVRLAGIADLVPERAKTALATTGWGDKAVAVTDDALALIAADEVEIVIEATGHPAAGIRHALAAIEMAAVANATGLTPPHDGLAFPPAGTHELAEVLKPHYGGGILPAGGMVEVVSSLARDGRQVTNDLRWGVYVTFAAGDDYAARCFREYGLATDRSGRYAAMWKPYHLIGLELGVSAASIAVRNEATGAPSAFRGDAVAVAKRDLAAGERLDGEGGATVWGKLLPASRSLAEGLLPIGLAQDVKLKSAIAQGMPLRWSDVEIDATQQAVRIRREMEQTMAPATKEAAA